MAIQAARFYRNPTNTSARSLFRASLLYISVFMVRQFRAFKSCCGHDSLPTSLRYFRISCQPVHMHPLCYVQFIVAIAIRSHNGPPGPTAHTPCIPCCAQVGLIAHRSPERRRIAAENSLLHGASQGPSPLTGKQPTNIPASAADTDFPPKSGTLSLPEESSIRTQAAVRRGQQTSYVPPFPLLPMPPQRHHQYQHTDG